MKTLWIIALGVNIALVALGCRTLKDEAQRFMQENPDEARYYSFKPAALEPIKYIEDVYLAGQLGLIQGVERRMNDRDELGQYLQRTRAVHIRMQEWARQEHEKIDASVQKGGRLYYYERRETSCDKGEKAERISFEAGLVVLQNGRIVYRQPYYRWEKPASWSVGWESEDSVNPDAGDHE